MSRRSYTKITFKVKIRLPVGVKANSMQESLKARLANIPGVEPAEVVITLDKRETVYLSNP